MVYFWNFYISEKAFVLPWKVSDVLVGWYVLGLGSKPFPPLCSIYLSLSLSLALFPFLLSFFLAIQLLSSGIYIILCYRDLFSKSNLCSFVDSFFLFSFLAWILVKFFILEIKRKVITVCLCVGYFQFMYLERSLHLPIQVFLNSGKFSSTLSYVILCILLKNESPFLFFKNLLYLYVGFYCLSSNSQAFPLPTSISYSFLLQHLENISWPSLSLLMFFMETVLLLAISKGIICFLVFFP